MLSLSSETQLRTYAHLRSLEARSEAIDELIRSLKRHCLHGRPGVQADLIAATAELRWQLRQVHELAVELEASLGAVSRGEHAPEQRTQVAEQPGIRGTTDVIGVPDLVNTLSSLQKTGTLALQAREAMFVFEFEEGKIVHAITNQQNPELRLGTILVAQNLLTEQQLQESLDASAQAKSLLGSHLVHNATVSESDLRAALDLQVRRIFDAAFALRDAHFSFIEGNLSNIAQRAAVNTTELLLEAARLEDEGRLNQPCDESGPLDSVLGG